MNFDLLTMLNPMADEYPQEHYRIIEGTCRNRSEEIVVLQAYK